MAKTLTPTTIAVTINGKDYSKYVQFPFKVSQLLDEQLDEACLMLVGVPDKIFKPLVDVTVKLTNGNKEKSYYMLVASDKSDEIPTGSGRYKHELYLIEQTKYLECFIVRSIGYLNPLKKEYTQVKVILETLKKSGYFLDIYGTIDFKTPIYANQKYIVPSPSDLTEDWESNKFPYTMGYYTYNRLTEGETIINNNGKETVYTYNLWGKNENGDVFDTFIPERGFIIVTIKSTYYTYDIDNPPMFETVNVPLHHKGYIICRFEATVI